MTPKEQKQYDYILARLAKWESLGIKVDEATELFEKCTNQCANCEAYLRAEKLEKELFDAKVAADNATEFIKTHEE